jgi:hypothetical protein
MRMRLCAHFAIALGLVAAGGAAAQPSDHDRLKDAAFARSASVVWQSSEMRLPGSVDGPVDSLRIKLGSQLRLPGVGPGEDRFDVTVVRSWPRAVSFDSDGLAFDIAPHAGFGVSNLGTQAEGGATLTVSKSRGERALEQLRDLGVKDGTSFGDKGRWYLFAAASGRAVGLNLRQDEGGWTSAGWSEDRTAGFVTSAQAGLAWRKGPAQASIGYVRRKVRMGGPQGSVTSDLYADLPKDDDLAGFTFSYAPR